MLHPIGSLPPGVYWRRRVLIAVVAVAAVVLVVLTFHAMTSRATGVQAGGAGPTGGPSLSPAVASSARTSTAPTTTPVTATTSPTATASVTPTTPTTGSAMPPNCTPGHLKIAAATGAPTYKIGDEPVVEIQVTNTGTVPCVEDLADPKIELRVYNGAARVWGSHDCQVVPGTDLETLPVGQTIGKTVQWSGLTSQPACAGVRQRVGAGKYTLYALLNGVQGSTAVFTIS
ncbi:MAG TPA: hypothetical protein VK816_06540 [Jatrophihabitantaceae bacterium]|nr:hypothetical protein [Jatrophihabitantaceae bacterium]